MLKKVLSHICIDFSKPRTYTDDGKLVLEFAFNVQINTINAFVRFFASILNVIQAKELKEEGRTWTDEIYVAGDSTFHSWATDNNDMSIAVFAKICMHSDVKLELGSFVLYNKEENIKRSLRFIKKFISRDDIWRQYYELIGYDWTKTGLDSIVDDYQLASIKDDIVRPFCEAKIDVDQLIQYKVSFYVEFFENGNDNVSYFGV
jgi:hypothetical protein